MSGTHAALVASPFRQPKAVFAIAFACVVSFMGIGLVDPILPAISHELHASPSEVTLLFTSYLVVTAVAMLITNWVSAGRMIAEYANAVGAHTIVVGASSHGGLPALMDGSASRELWRHTRSNVLIVNPDAPGPMSVRRVDRSADAELLRG